VEGPETQRHVQLMKRTYLLGCRFFKRAPQGGGQVHRHPRCQGLLPVRRSLGTYGWSASGQETRSNNCQPPAGFRCYPPENPAYAVEKISLPAIRAPVCAR
jgi:hypothetical protein